MKTNVNTELKFPKCCKHYLSQSSLHTRKRTGTSLNPLVNWFRIHRSLVFPFSIVLLLQSFKTIFSLVTLTCLLVLLQFYLSSSHHCCYEKGRCPLLSARWVRQDPELGPSQQQREPSLELAVVWLAHLPFYLVLCRAIHHASRQWSGVTSLPPPYPVILKTLSSKLHK